MSNILSAIVVQFGPHFAKNIAPLKTYFTLDPGWTINPTHWGLLQTAVSIPCAIFPWVVGRYVDRALSAQTALTLSLIIVCVGQIVFIIAVKDNLFSFALFGRFVFGIGEGLTSSLPGCIAVKFIPRNKMFAIGLTASFHALAVGLSKATLAPVALHTSYVWALFLSFIMCLLSLLLSVFVVPVKVVNRVKRTQSVHQIKLPLDFWIVAAIHLLFSSSHRLFGHIDAPFLQEKLGHSASVAGYTSSLTELIAFVVAPILGAILDRHCPLHALPTLLLLAAVGGFVAYGVLAMPGISVTSAEICLVLIGVVNGVTPTVLKAVVAETVSAKQSATAFGVYESSEAMGVIGGSVMIGLVVERAPEQHYDTCIPLFSVLLLISCILASVLLVRGRIYASLKFREFSTVQHEIEVCKSLSRRGWG